MSFTGSSLGNDKFWSRVDVGRPDECWRWTGATDTGGYGHLRWGGSIARAHRVAFTICNGPIPDGDGHHGAVIRHSCDNRVCCNPKHLLLGTQAENMADMQERGRRKRIGSGSANGRAKLTSDQVVSIRADTRGKRAIAPEYGISPAQVQRIRRGLQWSDESS